MKTNSNETTRNKISRSKYPTKVTEKEAILYVEELKPRFFNDLSTSTKKSWDSLTSFEQYNSLRYQYRKLHKSVSSPVLVSKCSLERHIIKPTCSVELEGLNDDEITTLFSKLSALRKLVSEEISTRRQKIDLLISLSERKSQLRVENVVLQYLLSLPNEGDSKPDDSEPDIEDNLTKVYESFSNMSKKDMKKRFRSNYVEIRALSERINNK